MFYTLVFANFLNGLSHNYEIRPSPTLSVDSDSLWSDFFVKNLGIFCKYPKDVAFTPAPECRSQCQQ